MVDQVNGVTVLAFLEAVLQAKDIRQIWDLHCRQMAQYGFDRLIYAFTGFRNGDPFVDLDDALILSNHEQAYLDEFVGGGLYRDAPMVKWAVENDGVSSWRVVHERAMRGELTPAEKRVLELNEAFRVRAGYSLGFGSGSSRAHGAIGLCARVGLSQKDVDAVWERYERELKVMNNVVHLRISSMPFATSRRALTNRQREVLEWVAEGKTTADIAVILGVTASTVEKHLRLAREALDVDTTAQAVVKASMQRQIFLNA